MSEYLTAFEIFRLSLLIVFYSSLFLLPSLLTLVDRKSIRWNLCIIKRNKQERKSYYTKYKQFWNRLVFILYYGFMIGIVLYLLIGGLSLLIMLDIGFYKETNVSVIIIVLSVIFCLGVIGYIIYYFVVLIPNWLKNLDMERGIEFDE